MKLKVDGGMAMVQRIDAAAKICRDTNGRYAGSSANQHVFLKIKQTLLCWRHDPKQFHNFPIDNYVSVIFNCLLTLEQK